jgi:hypothetical protein
VITGGIRLYTDCQQQDQTFGVTGPWPGRGRLVAEPEPAERLDIDFTHPIGS